MGRTEMTSKINLEFTCHRRWDVDTVLNWSNVCFKSRIRWEAKKFIYFLREFFYINSDFVENRKHFLCRNICMSIKIKLIKLKKIWNFLLHKFLKIVHIFEMVKNWSTFKRVRGRYRAFLWKNPTRHI